MHNTVISVNNTSIPIHNEFTTVHSIVTTLHTTCVHNKIVCVCARGPACVRARLMWVCVCEERGVFVWMCGAEHGPPLLQVAGG